VNMDASNKGKSFKEPSFVFTWIAPFCKNTYSSFFNCQVKILNLLTRAYNTDTVQKNKIGYIDSISAVYKRAKDHAKRLEWVSKSYALNANPTNRDIYDYGEAAYMAKNYQLADSMFRIYKDKFPDQVYGTMWIYKTAQAADTTFETAVQPALDYISFLKADTVKYKSTLVQVNGALAGYYANTKKDADSAIYYLQQILVYDPTNADATKYINILQKAKSKSSGSTGSKSDKETADKPKTGNGAGKK